MQGIREKTQLLQFPDVPTALDERVHMHRNPSLEVVRTMCDVMSLHRGSSEVVSGLRRNLLCLLGLREFSKEAHCVDPSLPIILRNRIYSFSYEVVDIDPARKSRMLVPASVGCHGQSESLPLLCEDFSHPYDLADIELALVCGAQKLVVAYQVRDVECRKC